jgi:predicted transcriptional regulator
MYIQTTQQEVESIRRGIAEIQAGHYISHEPMKAWLLSLSLDHPLPLPKCVCGESHDELD